MRKQSFLSGILAAAVVGTACSAASAWGVGTTGAQFLKVGVGARPLAMGSAYAAMADDADAVYWNPGALGTFQRRDLTASYNSLFKDQNQGFIAYAAPLGQTGGTLGLGFDYLMVGKIEKRAADTEDPDSTFSDQNIAMSVAYGRPTPVQGLSVGGAVKYIRESMDTFRANALALDVGAVYQTPVPNLTAGAVVRNFGTKVGPDPLPTLFKAGAAYRMFKGRLALASDVDWLPIDQRSYLDLGTEFWAAKTLALRAGYQFGRGRDHLQSKMVGAGFGMGLRVDRLRMDYAFLPFGDLGDTHRITVGWSF